MDRFIGNMEAKIDAKGRVFVPATFRKTLSSWGEMRLILRKDIFQDCIILYPEKVWDEELIQLRTKLNKWDEKQQRLFRHLSTQVDIVEIDANGRILIPKRYLRAVNITGEVRFVGTENTIELWSCDEWEKSILSAEELKDSVREFLANPNNE